MEINEIKKIVLETAESCIKNNIEPIASEIDEKEIFPIETIKEIARLGLLSIPFPQEVGGIGLDYSTYFEVIKKIARTCASTAMTIVSHTSLSSFPIYKFGTDIQKENILKQLLSGEKLGAFALTEPQAGSDLSSITTIADEKDDYYLLNGSKVFITNANYADVFIVAAKTSPKKNMMGISVFYVDKEMDGVIINGTKEKKLGMRGSDTGTVIFQDVKVPKDNLIGRKNLGIKVLHETLTGARLGMASIGIGIATESRDRCIEYVKQRKQFNKQIMHFQSIKNILADMEVRISASDLLLKKATELKDNNKNYSKEASEAKLFASETAVWATQKAIQLYGGYGYSRELPLERFYRDAKLTEIGDGTSEIQRLIIADEILKKPQV